MRRPTLRSGAFSAILIAFGIASSWLPASAAAAIGPLTQFGSMGSGAGQFNVPRGLALDPSGNPTVAEYQGFRVSQFSSAGSFVRAFGYDVIPGGGTGFEICTLATTCKAGVSGTAAGQFFINGDAAIDGAGNLYVAALATERINVFGPDATFLRAFGYDVIPGGGTGFEICTTTTTCKTGVTGGAAGQLAGPHGLAVDGAGNLYVVEAGNSRVSVFTTEGSFIRAFGLDVVPGGGTGPEVCTAGTSCKAGVGSGDAGGIASAFGAALDGLGNLYIGDQGNHRISVFSTDGSFQRSFGYDVIPGGSTGLETCTVATTCKSGVSGGAAGQLGAPFGVAVDRFGNLYTGEGLNSRISHFTTGGSFVEAFGYDVIPGGSSGYEICTSATTCKTAVFGNGPGQLSAPVAIETDCWGAVWVAESNNNRVQRFGEPGTPLPPSCPQNPPAAKDTLAPTVSAFSLSRKRFRVGSGATPVSAQAAARRRRPAPRGSRFRFTLSERAGARIAIERALRGRRVGKRCRAPSPKLRKRRSCTRFKRVGTLTRANRAVGRNTIRFSGRIGKRALKPGRYRATITATDGAGNRSLARRASFRIAHR